MRDLAPGDYIRKAAFLFFLLIRNLIILMAHFRFEKLQFVAFFFSRRRPTDYNNDAGDTITLRDTVPI